MHIKENVLESQNNDNDNIKSTSMNANKALNIVESQILSRQLNAIEHLIFIESWQGKGYTQMAKKSGYGSNYFKEVGSGLWHDISRAIGQKVTKKNLQIVFRSYQPLSNNIETHNITPQITSNSEISSIKAKIEVKNNSLESDASIHEEKPYYSSKERVSSDWIKFPSSPITLESPLYIERPPVENLVTKEINKPGCIIRIKAPKKMGKSSLLYRLIAYAQNVNYKTVYIDFQEAEYPIFTSLDKFLRWFCANVSRQLDLVPQLDEYWDEDMGSKVSCKIYFEKYLLSQINSPIILTLNEVNRIFEYPIIARDFLPMLRFWHEIAQQLEIWQKLRLVIAHNTENYVSLRINQSPFNIGLAIALPVFNLEQVIDLAYRYGLNCGNSQLQQLMEMVGGHPYLINLAFYYLCREQMSLSHLLRTAHSLTGIYSNHLRGHLLNLREQPELSTALCKILNTNSGVEVDAIVGSKLESMGLIKLEGNEAKLSCKLYHLYFQEQLQ
ncbi:MAG: AAA-like domain-containing protein [Cyanobacteria bacterium P01_A01_bin.68]